MTVGAMAIYVFIMHVPIFKPDLFNQPAFHDKGQASVDRCLGYLAALLTQPQVEFIHIKVNVIGKYLRYYLLAFRGITKTLFEMKDLNRSISPPIIISCPELLWDSLDFLKNRHHIILSG